MNYLKVTLIDVGWGDSILLETGDDAGGGPPLFALIDSNDDFAERYRPGWDFLRKHFGRRGIDTQKPLFDFVMLSHDHADHGQGLKKLMQKYGARRFLYSKTDRGNAGVTTSLISYANHGSVRIPNHAVDDDLPIPDFGPVRMKAIWPPRNTIDHDPNNNSIVLCLELDGNCVVLTGDAEAKVWNSVSQKIPVNARVFKVPHHGSKNGTLSGNATPWLDRLAACTDTVDLAISCHPTIPRRFDHPHDVVLQRFSQAGHTAPFRTDLHYHVTFNVDRNGVRVQYSH